MTARRRQGVSLPEALAAAGLCGLLLAGAAAVTARTLHRERAPAAARLAASDFRRCRSEAVASGTTTGLQLAQAPGGEWTVATVDDGDGDGIRTDDLRRGIDRTRGPARDCRTRWGVAPGFARALQRLRSPPPDDELLRDLSDPVQFGRRDIVSFSPRGTATPGTLYLTDGTERQVAVVLAGGTARVRVWEYRMDRQRWVRR